MENTEIALIVITISYCGLLDIKKIVTKSHIYKYALKIIISVLINLILFVRCAIW